jgi:sarcosine oxidase subunit delta
MLLCCPWCGPRELEEFRFRTVATQGREATGRDTSSSYAAVYERANTPDSSTEYWQHDRGCRAWLVVQRNPSTAQVLAVRLLETGEAAT